MVGEIRAKIKKCPRLLVAPAIENSPRHHQIQKQIHDLDGVYPIEPATRVRLQHLADAGEDPRHSQGQNDRNEDGEITERVH